MVGVSRASKSSTCFYLAYAGIRAANVPLVADMRPLPQLLELPPENVVGLRVNVMRPRTIRVARARRIRLDPSDRYIDKREIAREVLEANKLMDHYGWRSIDVSYMATEEIAREVLALSRLKGSIHWQ